MTDPTPATVQDKTDDWQDNLADRLQASFPDALLDVERFRGEVDFTLRAAGFLDVARFLRDDPDWQFVHLADLTALDRSELPEGQRRSETAGSGRFAGIYHLFSISNQQRIRLTVPAEGPDDRPTVPSLYPLWKAALPMEREAFDLMGVHYEGHPDLRRIMMPWDWQGHPLRKDYPLGGEEVPFSMTWNDPEFASFGKQIRDDSPVQVPLPKGVDLKEHMVLNLGPHHPATHGVLRLAVELDGETLVSVYPDTGYLHSGFEKQGENVRYKDFVPYTDRMDYTSAMNNNLGYALAVEKLLDVEIPPRAQAIRVVVGELQRIAAHLVWLATSILDTSGTGMSILFYALREREIILDIFEMICGARMTTSYVRPGGLWKDVPPAFYTKVDEFCELFPHRLDEYERMLTNSIILRKRLEGVGRLSPEDALSLGLTGPLLRGSGVKYDLRKLAPYSGYERYDFEVPTATEGDSYARYRVRMQEMRQSLRIVEQAMEDVRATVGEAWMTGDRKVALPVRSELEHSMEALIHHFKLVTEGIKPPPGEVYVGHENPKGELGYYLVSDGSAHPYRLRVRGPSFVNIFAADTLARGHFLSDLITIIGSIDIVLGEVDR
ncbi:MAG: NADH dehydrogenase (quinone) subunit D [Chloroflexota bacterium]|nr:NADH dehydrogenase (quinone) subunit D [Chloroflexota bacterium]